MHPANLALALTLVVMLAGLGTAVPPTSDAKADQALPAGASEALSAGEHVALQLGPTVLDLSAEPQPILAPGVEPVEVHGDGTETTLGPLPVTTYVGHPAGTDALDVRLALDGAGVTGYVLEPAGGGWLLVPTGDGGADAVRIETIERTPIVDEDPTNEVVEPGPALHAQGPLMDERMKLRLAMEADNTYVDRNPDGWQEDLAELAFFLEGIYDRQFNVDIEVTYLGTTTPDPYPATHVCSSSDPSAGDGMLEQLQDHWNTHRGDVTRDVVQLYYDTPVSGAFTGCAFFGLDDAWSYSVTQMHAPPFESLTGTDNGAVWLLDNLALAAHELGHNWHGVHERAFGAYGLTGELYGQGVHTIMDNGDMESVLRFSELDGVVSPVTNYELDNRGFMHAYAQTRLATVE